MFAQFTLIAIIGVLTGGIVNVLADDLPAGQLPRSPKYRDGSRRPPLAYLGITAFLFRLRFITFGKERDQHHRDPLLSWRYPLTELATAALMLLFFFADRDNGTAPNLQILLRLIYVALLVLIAVVDLEHRRIPVVLLLPLAALALFKAIARPEPAANLASALFGGISGFVIFYLVFAGARLFVHVMNTLSAKRITARAFGFGDVLLMGVVGLIVGFPDIILAIYVTIFAGGLGAIAVIYAQYTKTRSYRAFAIMPYGPFIVAGALIVLLYGRELGVLLPGG